MSAVNFLELVKDLNYRYLYNVNKVQVKGISFDSRQVQPGHLFVALKGQQQDGHRYVQEALAKGAAAVIAEKEPPAQCQATWIQVSDSRLALAQLAAAFYGHPSRELQLTGVTGTSGKTTTTSLLQEIYKKAGLNAGLIGTVHIHCNHQSWRAEMTTPDGLEVQRLLRLMVDSGVTHAAMEVSSHSLAQKRVDSLHFDGSIFTNISPNHLDFHQDLEEYADTKKRLASLVQDRGFILVNGDERFFRDLHEYARAPLFSFGEHPSSDFTIRNIFLEKQGGIFGLKLQNKKLLEKISSGKDYFRFGVPLLGKHNIYNAAGAAAAALLTGISEESIFSGLASFRGVERRMQLYQLGDVYIIDDTAMNPGSINAVFNTLKDLGFSRLVLVYAIRGKRGTAVNEDNGRTLAGWAKTLPVHDFITTCSSGHVDEQNRVLPEEEEAFFRGALFAGLSPRHFTELPEALAQAVKSISPGATILLLGAQGMDAGLNILKEQLGAEEIKSAIPSVITDREQK